MLDKDSDGQEYQKYFEQLDDVNKQKVESGKLLIFLTGVTKPNGTVYTNLPTKVPCYIQLSEAWSENDIHTLFISSGIDSPIESEINTAAYFQNKYQYLSFPENVGKYVRLALNKFLPFAIFEDIDSQNFDTDGKYYITDYDSYANSARSFAIFGDRNSRVYRPTNDFNDSVLPDYKNSSDNSERNMDIRDSKVGFLILEEIIFTLLLATGSYIFKICNNRKSSDNKNDKSL